MEHSTPDPHTPPSGAPPAPVGGSRSIVPMIVVGAALAGLILAGVLVYRFVLPAATSAEDVAQDFVTAVAEGDALTACELGSDELVQVGFDSYAVTSCADFAEAAQNDPRAESTARAATAEVIEVQEVGDQRVVRLEVTPDGESPVPASVTLVREDNRWQVLSYSL